MTGTRWVKFEHHYEGGYKILNFTNELPKSRRLDIADGSCRLRNMNSSLTFTRFGTTDSVLVVEILDYRMTDPHGTMVKFLTSRGDIEIAPVDDLMVWNL